METSALQPPEKDRRDAKTPTTGPVNIVGIRIGYGLGAIGWLACFFVAYRLSAAPGVALSGAALLNILICLFGSTVGWWFGILLSPDPTERGQFSVVRKTLSAFLSGFVLAKVDILFQDAVAQNLTTNPLFSGRIILFVTTALICAQFTYVARHDLGMYGVRHAQKGELFRRYRRTVRGIRRES